MSFPDSDIAPTLQLPHGSPRVTRRALLRAAAGAGPTYPNRRFFFAGTASGLISTSAQTLTTPAANGTSYDRLDAHGISYGNWSTPPCSYVSSVVQDHTSITAFIERKWNLPPPLSPPATKDEQTLQAAVASR